MILHTCGTCQKIENHRNTDFCCRRPLLLCTEVCPEIAKCSEIVFFGFCLKKRGSFVPLASKSDAYLLLSLLSKSGWFSFKIDFFLKSELKIHIGCVAASYKDYHRNTRRSNRIEPFYPEVHKHKLWALWRAQRAPKAWKWSCTHVAHAKKSRK